MTLDPELGPHVVQFETQFEFVWEVYPGIHNRAIWLEQNNIKYKFLVFDYTVVYDFEEEKDAALFKTMFQ